MRALGKLSDRSIDSMFVFCNPCACAELHQQKRVRKLFGHLNRGPLNRGLAVFWFPSFIVNILHDGSSFGSHKFNSTFAFKIRAKISFYWYKG